LFLGVSERKVCKLTDSVVCLADVDVVDPDEKSIMTYVAQFLQYSKDGPGTVEGAQVCLIATTPAYFFCTLLVV
jgi:hypothetical protein